MYSSKQTFIEFPRSTRYYSRCTGKQADKGFIWGNKFWGGVRGVAQTQDKQQRDVMR